MRGGTPRRGAVAISYSTPHVFFPISGANFLSSPGISPNPNPGISPSINPGIILIIHRVIIYLFMRRIKVLLRRAYYLKALMDRNI